MAASNHKGNGCSLTLDALAESKRLPSDLLNELGLHDLPQGGVGIPYYGPTGDEIAVKRRTALQAKDGTFWPAGQPLAAYGQWRIGDANKAGFVILVEGESDCWALWHHGLPALGIPGANATKAIELEHIEALETVHVHREPDQGGERFVAGVRDRLVVLGFTGKLFELTLPAGVKDPADLHVLDSDRFKERMEEAIRASKPIPLAATNSANSANRLAPSGWPEPIPLGAVPDVPTFPAAVLPLQLRGLVDEIAWAMNCPMDFAAVPLLALAGGAIANSRHLAVTRSHTQAPCLFAVVVGAPGTLKTGPLKLLRRPFDEVQRRQLEAFQTKLAAWKAADEENRGPKPKPCRCIVGDTTTESLALTLDANPRGVVMVRNELAALIASMNQYKGGKGQDRQVYLNLWDGDPIIIDRKSDHAREGAPIFVPDAFTAIVGTMQPDVLRGLKGESYRGTQPPNDGFLDRFLIVYPKEQLALGEKWREVSQEALDAWRGVAGRLLDLRMEEEEGGRIRPHFVRLTDCGKAAWEQFTHSLADELNGADFPSFLRGPWAKLKGYGARLALIVHCLRLACGEKTEEDVDGASVSRAADLVTYFQGHARKVYNIIDANTHLASARRVVRWIIANRLERFTKREAFEGLKGTFKTVEELEAALAVVENYGFIRPQPSPERPGPGRKPSPIFDVHPATHTSSRYSHNSHNPSVAPDSANCANSTKHVATNESEDIAEWTA